MSVLKKVILCLLVLGNCKFLISCSNRISCKGYIQIKPNTTVLVKVGNCFYGLPKLVEGGLYVRRIDRDSILVINTANNNAFQIALHENAYVGYHVSKINTIEQSAEVGYRVSMRWTPEFRPVAKLLNWWTGAVK